MGKRRKRLEKGIDALDKVIREHDEKRVLSKKLGNLELVKYYDREIAGLQRARRNKESKRDRRSQRSRR